MRRAVLSFAVLFTVGLVTLSGCELSPATEFIAGTAGSTGTVASVASVGVVAPPSDLAVAGGTPIETSYRAVGTTPSATVSIFFDLDTIADNDNEILVFENLPLTETSALLDTSSLDAGAYYVGVLVYELTGIAAFDYAPGRIIVNQRPRLFFDAPRGNFVYDRSNRINPTIDVAWSVYDPDSTISVDVFLDPNPDASGDEILLRHSDQQTGDSFSFELRTDLFEAGVYDIVAVVTDGVNTSEFPAPGSIRLRQRLSGMKDLRELDDPASGRLPGVIFEGFNPGDNAGSFVSTLEDADGDGFSDMMILAQFGKPNYQSDFGRNGVGEAYLVYGRANRYTGKINLNSTGTLFRGEIFTGPPQQADPIRPSRGITAFDLMSDWDGDGVRELAFGLPFTDSLSISQVINDNDEGRFAPLDASGYFRSGAVIIAAGVVLRPDLGFPGRQVISLGEIGTLAHVPWSCLACEIDGCPCPEGFYGPKAPQSFCGATFFHEHWATVEGTPNFGSVRMGCRISSNDFGDAFGETISSYDFDGLMIAAPNRDPAVATTTSFGVSRPGSGVISLYFVNVASGFAPWSGVQAPEANDAAGYRGMTIGDNRLIPHGGPYHYILDDFRTFAVSAGPDSSIGLRGSPGYSVDPDDSTDPCEYVFDEDAPQNGRTVRFWSSQVGARMGNVRGIRDFNSDGLQDLVIGAPFANEGRGACYIVLGRLRELVMGAELQIEELQLPQRASSAIASRIYDGIRVVGDIGERLGDSQDDAGDFNNDGVADVVLGSPLTSNRHGGAAVFYGSRDVINLTQEEISYHALDDRGLGVIFTGETEGDLAGARVKSARDIDGDGFDDLLIAAPNRSVRLDIDDDGELEIDRTNCGVVYLVYGAPDLGGTISLADVGTEKLPGVVFIGRHSGDFLGAGLGDQGDRSHGTAPAGDVDGDGYGDILLSSINASPRDRVAAGEVYLIYGDGE